MSNVPHQGSPGAPHLSYSTPATGNTPRRSSYASVAAGAPPYSSSDSSPHPLFGSRSNPSSNPIPSVQLPRIINTDQSTRRPQSTSEAEPQADANVIIAGSGGRGSSSMTQHLGRRQSSHGSGPASGGTTSASFIRPSYLQGSTYMEKLEIAHQADLVQQVEEQSNRQYNAGSLSASSSSVSLQKMAPSHRGMTYDIVENQIPQIEDGPAPLPTKWAQIDKWGGLEIGPEGVDVRYIGSQKLSEHEAAAARTDNPMPTESGIYYYEVNILHKGKDGLIGVGFSGNKASLEKLPGWEPDSWAYHGDDGMSFCCQSTGKQYGPTFTTGDVIGCGVNFLTNQAFFTKNGVFLGYAFKDMRDTKLYPSVGMKRPNAHLEANFGQRPFCYDIDGMIKSKQTEILQEIKATDVSILHPTLDRSELCKALVAQYLSHDGYNETAKAFAREVRSEELALRGPGRQRFSLELYLAGVDDSDAAHRQQIRMAILDGQVDEAINMTDRYYPNVLADNPQIFFRLKCRKFIEMMLLSTEYLDAASGVTPLPSKNGKKANLNGHHMTAHSDDGLDTDMDIDEAPVTVSTKAGGIAVDQNWTDRMDTEDPAQSEVIVNATVRHQELVSETIAYGKDLRQMFKEDQSALVTEAMKEIFGMFAYSDPRESEQAPLLDKSQRIPVAEALNSAILVSIGKSPSTALERLYKQTVVLTDLIGEDGGVGSFVNVRNILRETGQHSDTQYR